MQNRRKLDRLLPAVVLECTVAEFVAVATCGIVVVAVAAASCTAAAACAADVAIAVDVAVGVAALSREYCKLL